MGSEAVAFNEQTLFIGFTWIIALLAGLRLCRRWNGGDLLWGRFHLASLPIWFLSFAAATRYIEGFTVYLGYATIVAGPALVYAFAPFHRRWLERLRWGAAMFVVATQCFFAAAVLLTSSPRNLTALARAEALPLSRGFTVGADVQTEISRARSGVTHHSFVWGQPYWPLMAYHPGIRQFLGASPQVGRTPPDDDPSEKDAAALRYSRYVLMPPPGDPTLHVYPIRQWPAWGYAVLRIPDKATPGLTLVGNLMFALGPEWLFAAGNGVEARHPGRDRYIGFHFYEVSNFGHDPKPILQITQLVFGLGAADRLDYRYELRSRRQSRRQDRVAGSASGAAQHQRSFGRQRRAHHLRAQQQCRRHGRLDAGEAAGHEVARAAALAGAHAILPSTQKCPAKGSGFSKRYLSPMRATNWSTASCAPSEKKP